MKQRTQLSKIKIGPSHLKYPRLQENWNAVKHIYSLSTSFEEWNSLSTIVSNKKAGLGEISTKGQSIETIRNLLAEVELYRATTLDSDPSEEIVAKVEQCSQLFADARRKGELLKYEFAHDLERKLIRYECMYLQTMRFPNGPSNYLKKPESRF